MLLCVTELRLPSAQLLAEPREGVGVLRVAGQVHRLVGIIDQVEELRLRVTAADDILDQLEPPLADAALEALVGEVQVVADRLVRVRQGGDEAPALRCPGGVDADEIIRQVLQAVAETEQV